MTWFKHIAMAMLCMSVILAGFPVQAKPQCSMAAQMHMQQMDMKDMKDCKGCTKIAKQEPQKKNGCCGDMDCAAKCSSMSNASTMFFGAQHTPLSIASIATERFYSLDNALPSHFLNTQDRPPKYLS